MIFKIIKWGYRNPEDSLLELVVEDSCGNEFQGILKLNYTSEDGGEQDER